MSETQNRCRGPVRSSHPPDTTAALELNRLIHGDALGVMRNWPDACVDTIVTSPPYFNQRDYQHKQQLGRNQTVAAYVTRLCQILHEAWRVTRATGSMWLVLGDKYERGQLLGIPWRVALCLQDNGWQLRSDVIWHKPNAMPSSVKNRPTTDHEYVFFFARSDRYFYDADGIREPHVTFTQQSRMKGGRRHFFQRGSTPENGKNAGQNNLHNARWDQAFHPKGRNKRTVWSIPLSKFREAHFAVFPEKLVETCLRASCPPGGVVLDPFVGSGTTAVVARRLGHAYLGIDCNAAYCAMARRRLRASEPQA